MFRYHARVRGTLYLWGSAGISVNMATPLLLHIRNDVHGEVVTFGTESVDGSHNTIGKLQPGECYSILLQNVRGVFAECDTESRVACRLTLPR
jgi:hypothetical protein